MDRDMRQGWEHVVGCGGMWQGVRTCGIGGGRVWGHVEGVWISQLHECSSYVQTAMCKLVVQTLCANWSCKLYVQTGRANCYVQIGRANCPGACGRVWGHVAGCWGMW